MYNDVCNVIFKELYTAQINLFLYVIHIATNFACRYSNTSLNILLEQCKKKTNNQRMTLEIGKW